MNPVWSSIMRYGKTRFNISAIHADSNLYEVFNNDIGLHFFKYNLSLFPFGSHVITPCFSDSDNSPLSKQSLIALNKKWPKSSQKNLKNSYVNPSKPELVLFDVFFRQ